MACGQASAAEVADGVRLIIAEPAAHFANLRAAQAQLPGPPARIAHGEDRQLVALAARAYGAALGMVADSPAQQRAAQDCGV